MHDSKDKELIFKFLNINGMNLGRMCALGSTRGAENGLLQPEDRTSLASKRSRRPSS